MWTPASTDPKLRADLLTQAIKLSKSLNGVLEDLGASRFVRSSLGSGANRGSGNENPILRMYEKEDELRIELRGISVQRNNVISPISRLSDDVLQHIFFFLVDPLPYGHCDPKYGIPLPIYGRISLILSEICHRWRTLAIDTAKIWSNLHLVVFPGVMTSSTKPWHPSSQYHNSFTSVERKRALLADKASRHFLRSKQSDLNIRFDMMGGISQDPNFANGDTLNQFMDDILSPRLSRTASLILHLQHPLGVERGLSCLPDKRLTLRSLSLEILRHYDQTTAEFISVMNNFCYTEMPLLTEIRLVNIRLPNSFASDVNWPSFNACLKLSFYSFDEHQAAPQQLLALLRSCPLLEELTLHPTGARPTSSQDLFAKRERLSSLRLLTTSAWNKNSAILSMLEAPSLSELHLELPSPSRNSEDWLSYFEDVRRFLQVSSSVLRTFYFSNIPPEALRTSCPTCRISSISSATRDIVRDCHGSKLWRRLTSMGKENIHVCIWRGSHAGATLNKRISRSLAEFLIRDGSLRRPQVDKVFVDLGFVDGVPLAGVDCHQLRKRCTRLRRSWRRTLMSSL